MIAFAKRNLKLYLRDKGTVFFSLLTVFIVIGLYVLFLGDTYTDDLGEIENTREIMDNWVMAGVLAITSMTTTLGMLSSVVKDKVDKIEKDFYVAPIKRVDIAGGYMLSAYIVGVCMTFLAFIAAEIYIAAQGGAWISPEQLIKVMLMILYTSLMNTSIALFLVTLFKSIGSYTAANVLVGTLIGFLTGIYLPIGMLTKPVQWIIKIFPMSHAAAIFRNLMMSSAMETGFEHVPQDIVQEIKEYLGMFYRFGEIEVGMGKSLMIMGIVTAVFFILASLQLSKKRRG